MSSVSTCIHTYTPQRVSIKLYLKWQIESKRVQYRKYLERAGVIDALSKALIKLYEEQNKPDDAIRFVRKYMCETCPDDTQFDAMKNDLENALKKISALEQDLERCKALM